MEKLIAEIKELLHSEIREIIREEITNAMKKKKREKPVLDPKQVEIAKRVLEYLNKKAGTVHKPTNTNVRFVIARLNEGYSLEEIKTVIDLKISEWRGGEFAKFLRPSTLFDATKFSQYAGIAMAPTSLTEKKESASYDF